MTDVIALAPGQGHSIAGLGTTVKATTSQGALASTFECVIKPGYDVGAHVHTRGQEFFFVLEGQLDVLAFEPLDRSVPDWHDWRSPTGLQFIRGGPGSFLWVPEGTPHAFANHTSEPARMFFQSSAPGGHENYFEELSGLLARPGAPDEAAITALRLRYDIQQITDLRTQR